MWHGRHVRIYGRKAGIADTDYGPAPESELALLTADETAERSRAEQIWASDRIKLLRQIASASLDLHLCVRSVFNALSVHVKAGAMGIPSSSLPSLLHQPPIQFSPPLTTREVDVVRGACTTNKAGCIDAESLAKGFDALIAHQVKGSTTTTEGFRDYFAVSSLCIISKSIHDSPSPLQIRCYEFWNH